MSTVAHETRVHQRDSPPPNTQILSSSDYVKAEETAHIEFERGELLAHFPDPDEGTSDQERKIIVRVFPARLIHELALIAH